MNDFNWNDDLDILSILQAAPGYIFWKDVNSVYRGCNLNGAILYGMASPYAIMGKTDADCGQQFAAEFVRQDQFVIQTEQSYLSERDVINMPDGKIVILRTTKTPLRNKSGRVVGVLSIAVNITDSEEKKLLDIENATQSTMLQ